VTLVAKRLLTIVSPCYNEEKAVEACYRAVREVVETQLPGYDFEHIFADNASTDGTVAELKRLAKKDKRIKVVVNARNYGPFRSTFNALMHSRGDAVLVMLAVDLQDPPSLLPEFVKQWRAGHKVVYGVRRNRKESLLMRGARSLFYRLIAMSSDIRIPLDAGEFQLVDKQVIDGLRRYRDHYPYIRGMIANVGFKSVGIPYDWGQRKHGKSRNNLLHLYDQAVNGLISFSNLPMRLMVFSGLFLAAASLLYAFGALLLALFSPHPLAQSGIMTLIIAFFFLTGMQLVFVGVIGEYVAAIHAQVRQGAVVVEQELVNLTPLKERA
jgi:glycosyltransferase involved in cell wall biosynthesis